MITPFSYRQINKVIRKLRVVTGDVILIKAGTALANTDTIDSLRKSLEDNRVGATILVVDDFSDLSVLDQQQMAKAGYFKVEALRKIVHKENKN